MYKQGEERVVVGAALILRETANLKSRECGKAPSGARVRIAECTPTEEGLRAKVLVLPKEGGDDKEAKACGWLTAVKNGKERLARVHRKVDVDERRHQFELWNRRLAADRAMLSATKAAQLKNEQLEAAGKKAATVLPPHLGGSGGGSAIGGGGGGSPGSSSAGVSAADLQAEAEAAQLSMVGPSFAHEIADCSRGIAFAFGGLYPGTLHAHGELVTRTSQLFDRRVVCTYCMWVCGRRR